MMRRHGQVLPFLQRRANLALILGKAERQARYLKNRRAKGLCGWSGCPEHSGDAFHCDEHRERHAVRSLRDYHRRKEAASAVRPAAP